jgi:hypothetical protein
MKHTNTDVDKMQSFLNTKVVHRVTTVLQRVKWRKNVSTAKMFLIFSLVTCNRC